MTLVIPESDGISCNGEMHARDVGLVAVAMQEGSLSRHLGRAGSFAIFRVRDGRCGPPVHRIRSMPCHEQGAGCRNPLGARAALLAILEACDVVVCGGLSVSLAGPLRAAGILPFVTDAEGTPEEICRRFVDGSLRGSFAAVCDRRS